MASTDGTSSSTLKLDPDAATGLITRGTTAGAEAAVAGATDGVEVAAGESPIDLGVGMVRTQGVLLNAGWATDVASGAAERESGETGGVSAMSATESENVGRMSSVEPQAAATITV